MPADSLKNIMKELFKHTFLFEEGVWAARGKFVGDRGEMSSAEGRSRIIHMDGVWSLEHTMQVDGLVPYEFRNDYLIEPFLKGRDYTVWTSVNPELGRFTGHFAVIFDCIISFSHSEDGRFWGTEHMQKIDQETYLSRGMFFETKKMLSSWFIELKRLG